MRVAVGSRFVLEQSGAYGFALDSYDRRSPLVIDPGLVYPTFLGGSKSDAGLRTAVDAAGSG